MEKLKMTTFPRETVSVLSRTIHLGEPRINIREGVPVA